ncbi:MAG: hypothetical protein K1X54_11170 [Flavobacteriales bacterium]|nr:hypothetical protein [Flavobacteriales bacterium]
MRSLIVLSIILLISGLLFFSCKKKKEVAAAPAQSEAASTPAPTPQTNADEIKLLPINIQSDYTWPGSTDPFDVLSTEVKGDMLILEIQYGGGCQEHDFSMTTNLMWMKSMPPQLNLYLEHENHDDNCRALITRKLAFDLKECRYSNGNVVVLIINGDRDKSTRYQY